MSKDELTTLTHTKRTPGPQAAFYWNAQEISLTQPPWRESRWPKTVQPPIQLDSGAKGVLQKASWALLPVAWQFWRMLGWNARNRQSWTDLESMQCACPPRHLYCLWRWSSRRAAGGQLARSGSLKTQTERVKPVFIFQWEALWESTPCLPFLMTQGLKNHLFVVTSSFSCRGQGPNRAVMDCNWFCSAKTILHSFHRNRNRAEHKHLLQ